MSTQFETGEGYFAYQAEIAAGPATVLGHVAAQTAYQNLSKGLAKVLADPPDIAGDTTHHPLPSVGINVGLNYLGIPDFSPQRYVL